MPATPPHAARLRPDRSAPKRPPGRDSPSGRLPGCARHRVSPAGRGRPAAPCCAPALRAAASGRLARWPRHTRQALDARPPQAYSPPAAPPRLDGKAAAEQRLTAPWHRSLQAPRRGPTARRAHCHTRAPVSPPGAVRPQSAPHLALTPRRTGSRAASSRPSPHASTHSATPLGTIQVKGFTWVRTLATKTRVDAWGPCWAIHTSQRRKAPVGLNRPLTSQDFRRGVHVGPP